jgi:large subunit ribosomal protein L18
MQSIKRKSLRRSRRKQRVRKGVFGTEACPRLTVFRSIKNMYAQIIDDERGVTLCSASTRAKDLRDGVTRAGNIEAAKAVGKTLAERALAAGINTVAFDRNGYKYHGRIKALADAAREGGLKF